MKQFQVILLGLIAFSVINCSKDDSVIDPVPEVTISDFVGSWKATTATFTNNSNSSEKVEFIAAGGAIRFTMLDHGGVRTWVDFQNQVVDEWDAQASLGDDNTIKLIPVETSRPQTISTYELASGTITLTNTDDTFDFTGTGVPDVAATSIITFVPNE